MSTKQQKGLGKGLDVLMPQGVEEHLFSQDKNRVQNLFIKEIYPNADQPRRTFDESALQELADSIRRLGILQPIIVTPAKDGLYMIIAGERRWRASKIAGLQKIPAIVRTMEELELLEVALVENIQRVDLSPLEQAVSINRLHELFNQSYDTIAKRLGKAVSTVNNIVRLMQLPPAAQDALQNERISEGHARAILALKHQPERQEELLLLIQKHGWSVRQAEQFVVAAKGGAPTAKKATTRTSSTTPQTKQLAKVLDRSVTVTHMAKGGRLVIRFETDDDLDSLVQLLSTVKKS